MRPRFLARQIRSIKLELLRHGQAHNQLLSPLTRYMALSGDHEACIVHVPYTHEKFLVALRAMRYQERHDATRRAQLDGMAEAMAEILGSVPGLTADLSASGIKSGTFTHLRLVFSAAELALLPFELASAPSGFPGEGAPLALQLDAPLTITREVRAASSRQVEWPAQPRILFAVASPRGGIETRLVEAHVQGLRRAVAPFSDPSHTELGGIDLHLEVLPDASLRSIEQSCRHGVYTHVHILAHGSSVDASLGESRFGLALDDGAGGVDVVDGDRLASALRAHGESGLSSPTVVTVAACDSGQHGSVLVPGSSLAHSLHAAGIPLVVGSQFPLTKRGSVLLASMFYQRLLWGEDPRIVLHDLRQRLKGLDRASHDWASLVCHASLPADLESQLTVVKNARGESAVSAAVGAAWTVVVTGWKAVDSEENQEPSRRQSDNSDLRTDFDKSLSKLRRAIERVPASDPAFEKDLQRDLDQQADVLAALGNAQLLEAELLWLSTQEDFLSSEDAPPVTEEQWTEALREAKATFARAWRLHPGNVWAGTSYLRLKRVLDGKFDMDLFRVVTYGVQQEIERFSEEEERHRWASVNLLEICFYAVSSKELAAEKERLPAATKSKLKMMARDLRRKYGNARQVRFGHAQFGRLGYWWGINKELAIALMQILWPKPDSPEEADE